MKKYILSLFLGITITANAQILPVPEITQEQSEWCWVGVSKCVLDFYGYPHRQCEIAEYTRSVSTWHSFGTVPCCQSSSTPGWGCNYWNYNWYSAQPKGTIQDILVHFGNITNNGTGSLPIANIQNNINQQRPFIIRWAWASGGGHFIVGHGIQGNNIYYMDPWFGEGFKILSYENIKNDGWHEWTHTNVLTVSPGLSGIETVETDNLISIYPNPVQQNSTLTIESETIKAGDKIEIFDMNGKLISVNLASGIENSINIGALPQGVYLLKLGGNRSVKFEVR